MRVTSTLIALSLLAATPGPVTAEELDKRKSRLQGTVFEGRRDGVVGATVVVRPEEDSSRLYLTSTDARGQFRVESLPDGAYRVELDREGFEPVVKSDVELRFPFRAVVEVTLSPLDLSADVRRSAEGVPPATSDALHALQGRVADRAGKAVGDITLRLVRIDGSADPRLARTDDEGRFLVSELKPGAWRVQLRGVGFLPIHTEVVVDGGTELRFTLVRQPPDYRPSPLELMPPEEPILPEAFQG